MWLSNLQGKLESRSLRHMIFVAPVPGFAMPQVGNWNRSSFYWCHVSAQTAEGYLGCKQRLRGAVNDRIGIEPGT